jgi:hypothetical protein
MSICIYMHIRLHRHIQVTYSILVVTTSSYVYVCTSMYICKYIHSIIGLIMIWGFHGVKGLNCGILGHDIIQSVRWVPKVQLNMLLPSHCRSTEDGCTMLLRNGPEYGGSMLTPTYHNTLCHNPEDCVSVKISGTVFSQSDLNIGRILLLPMKKRK